MGGVKGMQAFTLVLLMALAPLAGCFGENESAQITENDVDITPKTWTAGVFQSVTITAEKSLSVFVPYLIKDADSGFVVNSKPTSVPCFILRECSPRFPNLP